jgi:predicted acetyltransferase
MSESFRIAREEDVPDTARLVGHSFIGRPPEYFQEVLRSGPWGGVEILWVGEERGRLTSACQLISFQQWVGGACLPMMGLAAVAVSPSHRRRRVAGRLVTSGLRYARERGDLVSALYPFRIRFYEELGYGLAGEAHQYLLPPEQFPDSAERLRIELVRGGDDRQVIRALYDRWAPTQNGQLMRHDGHWKRLWEGERAGVVYRSEGGVPEGYAVVRYRSDLAPAERFLDVEERVWLTPAARRGIYAWLASLGDQWRLLAYRAHPEEGFAEIVREPRLPLAGGPPHWGLWFPSATLMVGPMFRLLDVGRAWEQRRVEPSATTTLGLEVQDEQIPENAGSWRLRLEDGRVGVERSGGAGVDVSLRLPVRVLSRLFIGALTPTVAVDAGLAETDRPDRLAALDAALRLPRPWTFDRF